MIARARLPYNPEVFRNDQRCITPQEMPGRCVCRAAWPTMGSRLGPLLEVMRDRLTAFVNPLLELHGCSGASPYQSLRFALTLFLFDRDLITLKFVLRDVLWQ
jgi:hypothetical protein